MKADILTIKRKEVQRKYINRYSQFLLYNLLYAGSNPVY
ncbi:hypothetical protein SAMD00020551_2836 [Mesobacillus selenatarsenatis SF-1]|uniref:Uncharacterized protein n=1 Tax=Mesobacillus selenatarsenatis (strain DSM 18680 / JCM 14380 / FERM P-15431 / SF-1) TaxID=1321606 RepID=A0A0A8X412_MESS1|nr:hypothetical protein SAMD00020551_2836 [Mesobacillus selenatarsenatis SF-1]